MDLPGCIRDRLLSNESFLFGIHDLEVYSPKDLHLLDVGIEVRVGFAKKVFYSRPVDISHRLVDQRKASFSILGKHEVGVDVNDLS